MPRIIVTTDPSEPQGEISVLMDERVHSVHLAGSHAAAQLIERLAWAINDAEEEERTDTRQQRKAQRTPTARRPRSRASTRQLLSV